MAYEVQHHTLCDGWVNDWIVYDENDIGTPETFETYAAAEAALDEFFADIADEIAAGQRAPDEGYDRTEFRIVWLADP